MINEAATLYRKAGRLTNLRSVCKTNVREQQLYFAGSMSSPGLIARFRTGRPF
jgi:hypothetical protein